MAQGGFRPGSGRKRGMASITAENARAFMLKEIAKDLEPIMAAQKEAAKGLWYEKLTDSGKLKIYQRDPELRTGEYLLNQLVGRPREVIQLSGEMSLKLDV